MFEICKAKRELMSRVKELIENNNYTIEKTFLIN